MMDAQPKPSGSSTVNRVLIACLALTAACAVLSCLALAGGMIWLSSLPECPVRLGYEIPPETLESLSEGGLVDRNETVLAYYDDTITCDGSASAVLTDRRLIHHIGSATTSLPLQEITDVQRVEGAALAETIIVSGSGGETIRIEIALWNGGETFHTALLNAWHQATE